MIEVSRALLAYLCVRCIVEFLYIVRLRAGIIHIPNDRFDNMFNTAQNSLHWNSPEIWHQDRQDFIHNAAPVSVHSHNDYDREIPVFEALASGCISIEADIHLHKDELLVGHSSLGLRGENTLRSMYLEPLQRMIGAQNEYTKIEDDDWTGIFNRAPKQTIVLLVDHKTAGIETFDELERQLQPLRDLGYLTFWNGTSRVMRPLTIVASGEAPFESVLNLSSIHRDIFWDARLERLVSINDNFDTEPPTYGYNVSNTYYASTRWQNARLWPAYHSPALNRTKPTAQMKDLEASHIEQAKVRGLVSRYWDTPSGPANLQEIVWRVQLERQVGILNMDDMSVVRARASGWSLGDTAELR